MTRTLYISPRAVDDLENIYSYGLLNFGFIMSETYVQRINDTIEEISKHTIGTKRNEISPGLVSFPVVRHTLFYRSYPQQVVIARILHQSVGPKGHIFPF